MFFPEKEGNSMSMWKRRLAAFIVIVLLFTGGGLWWYFSHHTKTPEYAMQKITESLEKQDADTFFQYVDVDAVLDHSYEAFMEGAVTVETPMNDEAKAAVESFASVVKAPLLKSFHDAIRTYVTTGAWPQAAEGTEALLDPSVAIEKAGLAGTTFSGVDRIEMHDEDGTAVALVRVHPQETDEDFVLRVKLAPADDGHYRVTEVENYRDFVAMIAKARRAKVEAYLQETASLMAQHETAMREAESQRAEILSAGALGNDATRQALKELMENTILPDWQARKAELEAIDAPQAAQTLHRLRLHICDLRIDYAEGYAAWMTDKKAATIRDAETKLKQARTLEQEELFLTKRMAGKDMEGKES